MWGLALKMCLALFFPLAASDTNAKCMSPSIVPLAFPMPPFTISKVYNEIGIQTRVRNTETLYSRPTEYSVKKISSEKFYVSVEYEF